MTKNYLVELVKDIRAANPNIPVCIQTIECEDCGEPYETLAIDRHISKPHLCENCLRDIIREYNTSRSIPDSIFTNEQICPGHKINSTEE